MAETATRSEAQLTADKLKGKIGNTNSEPLRVVNHSLNEQPVNIDTKAEVVAEKTTEVKAETPPAPKAEAQANPRKISIFDDIKKATEEDSSQKNVMSKAAESLSESYDMPDEPTGDGGEDDPRVKRETNKITAVVMVELFDVIFMFLCMWASGDWSEKAQVKYTLPKERKKAIEVPLFQLLQRRKKKSNPVVSLIFLVLGSYAPMIILATMSGIKKRRNEGEEQEKQTELQNAQQQVVALQQELRNMQAQRQFNAQNPQFQSPQNFQAQPQQPQASVMTHQPVITHPDQFLRAANQPRKRGRHLHFCASKRGGICDCWNFKHAPGCPGLKGKKCTCYKNRR